MFRASPVRPATHVLLTGKPACASDS